MPESLTNMHTEPVAIVGTVLSAIAAICVAVVPVCVSNGWTVAASIVSALGVGASGVALTLGKRALTDSPATKAAQAGVPVPVIPARIPTLGDTSSLRAANIATADKPAPAGLAEQADEALKSIENQP